MKNCLGIILLLIISTVAFSQIEKQTWEFNEVEQIWFENGKSNNLLNPLENAGDFVTNELNYYRESGDFKRVFDGESESQFRLTSQGRKTIEDLVLFGQFDFKRDAWKNHQYNLDPGFGYDDYTPYYTGAQQAVESSEDLYHFKASVAKKEIFRNIGAELGFDYTISNLFGQTDPSGDVQKTAYSPKLTISLFDEVSLFVDYKKLKTEGKFSLKRDANSLLITNPFAAFFYTGYGTRVVSSINELNKTKDGFGVGISTQQEFLKGKLFAALKYDNGEMDLFQYEGIDDIVSYGIYNTDEFKGNIIYSTPLRGNKTGFAEYETSYFKSDDINKGINGDSNLALYEGNDYSHDLRLGYTTDEMNACGASLSFNYDDISRYEISKIAFVNKNLLSTFQLSKQYNDLANNWAVQPSISLGYNANLESDMVLTGSAGSNSPFFIQNIAIPETLYYRNDFFEGGLGVNLIKSLEKVSIGFNLDYKLKSTTNAEVYESFEAVSAIDGNRSMLNAGFTIYN